MNWNNSFLSIICISIVIAGCANYRIQNLDVDGAMLTPLVHISSFGDTARIHLSGYVETSLNGQRTGNVEPGHTLVNDRGIFEGDTLYYSLESDGDYRYLFIKEHPDKNINSFSGANYQWRLPKYTIVLGVEFPLTKDSYWTLRMNISPKSDYFDLGWGIGYARESISEKFGYRTDVGITSQQSTINAVYWRPEIDMTPNYYNFYFEKEKRYRFGLYTAITIFTTSPERQVNYFIQASLQFQRMSFFDNPRSLGDFFMNIFESRSGMFFLSFAPGISYNINKSLKLIGGLRLVSDLSVENTNGYFIVMPFIQSNVIF
jgi:hypothetical protein